MSIKISEIYPNEENYLEKIESEKCKWLLARLREKYSEDLIEEALSQLIDEGNLH